MVREKVMVKRVLGLNVNVVVFTSGSSVEERNYFERVRCRHRLPRPARACDSARRVSISASGTRRSDLT